MQTLIWAFGSMLVLLLILSFLPLGFSIKGKLLIVMSGFVLALIGHGSITTFPLWLTGIILVVLAFFTAYIMDGRMGAILYKEISLVENFIDENDNPDKNTKLLKNNYLLDITKTEVELPSIDSLPSMTVLKPSDDVQEKELIADTIDEDISFLMERNVDPKPIEDTNDYSDEVGYLTEIEGLLVEELEEKPSEAGWLDKIDEFSINNLENSLNDKDGIEEDLQLEELSFHVDIAVKEAAVGKELVEKSQPKLDPKVLLK